MKSTEASFNVGRGHGRAGRGTLMSLPLKAGGKRPLLRGAPGSRRDGFTLIELLLVLTLLAMAVAVAAPSLSRFFRGRTLDAEARRMLALTHYAQSRAVAEGVPMILWFRPDDNTYGLEAEITYGGADTRAVTNQVDSKLEIEPAEPMSGGTLPWKASMELAGTRPAIRFTPDGYIGETSPYWVWIKPTDETETDAVWLVMDDNHLNYELQSSQPVTRR